MDVEALKEWFCENRRVFPWREDPSPYRVWVSEVMLQQTRASVVEPYFLRWMEEFPTIASLATSSLEQVIKAWDGLGYYSRARNLHAEAKFVLERYQGNLPSLHEELIQIKGLGKYTVGAILSFAFHKKSAALDGNAIRVLSRYFAIQDDIQTSLTLKQLWILAEKILPENEPWLVTEGLIELGARVCMPKPNCLLCPLKRGCQALLKNLTSTIPYKSKKVEITPLVRSVFILSYQGSVLVQKKEEGLMANLYEFPYVEGDTKEPPFPLTGSPLKELLPITHHFTRFKATLKPLFFELSEPCHPPFHEWIPIAKLKDYPFSSGHRQIRMQLESRS